MGELAGLRVVRGKDWCDGNRDGGEGFVGMVTTLGSNVPGSPCKDGRVIVQWDTGDHGTYRVGENGHTDLRIYDTAPLGSYENIIMHIYMYVEGMAQWFRRFTHDHKVVGSIPGPDSVCFL